MANAIKVLFWLHQSKMNKDGLAPLILRLSFQKTKVDKATGYYVNPEQWNTSKQRLRGNKDEAATINSWIEAKLTKISTLCKDELLKETIHLPTVMEKVFSNAKEEPTILNLINEFNQQLKERLNNDIAYSTYEKYIFTANKVKAFIVKSLKRKDILLKDITTKFIMDFDHYLRVTDKNQHNTVVKYCINLKRILNVAVLQGVMPTNPLNSHKTTYKDTPQVYLNEHEVTAIENVKLVKSSHLLVRDLFLFQCYTGFAYTDMVSLNAKDISIDSKGMKWIIKARQKTGIVSNIPLLSKAIYILEKYSGLNKNVDGLFPHYSIQKYNQYIGEVGNLAGINKKLSSHVGRRTFGNIALSKGVSINVISKILGHSNTLITQRIYAITTQNIITNEIDKLN